MKRLSASLLALGLAATSGLAAAQSYGYDDDYDRNQVQATGTGYYDYACGAGWDEALLAHQQLPASLFPAQVASWALSARRRSSSTWS